MKRGKVKRGDVGLFRKLRAVIELGRPVNAVMVFLAAVIGGLLSGLDPVSVTIPALSAALISMGAQAVNDYFDVEVDRRKPHRKPLVAGDLTLKEARLVWFGYYLIGLVLAVLSSPFHLLVALVAVIGTYIYSWKVQKRKYIGNVVVSLFVALSLVYGGLGGEWGRTLVPALIAFLVNWGREVLKDVDDAGIDYPYKVSLFHVLGREWATFFGSYLVFLGVVFTPFPYLMGVVGSGYVPSVLLADLSALYAVAEALRGNEGRAEKILKVSMILALLSFLLGAVVR